MRVAARRAILGVRCAYRSAVVLTSECPSSLETFASSSPSSTEQSRAGVSQLVEWLAGESRLVERLVIRAQHIAGVKRPPPRRRREHKRLPNRQWALVCSVRTEHGDGFIVKADVPASAICLWLGQFPSGALPRARHTR